jgi:YHS domain-containing protein
MKVSSLTKISVLAILISFFLIYFDSPASAKNLPQDKQTKKEVTTEKQTKQSPSKKEETQVKKVEKESLVCAVTGEEADPEIKMDYKGKTYYLCCNKCLKKFKSNPEKYIKSQE